MMFGTVAIIGVGLIGGSLGAALRQRNAAKKVVGIGYRQVTLDHAMQAGSVDAVTTEVAEGVRDADIVVIATPVGLIAEKAREIADSIKPDCIVTDAGSTKLRVVQELDSVFEGKGRFVGSHPMAGSDKRGAINSSPDLFDGALCLITPTEHTDAAAMETVEALWRAVGMHTRHLTPEQHDKVVALASHLPHLAASTLVALQDDTSLACASTGFADTTRVAAGDATMWRDICLDNADEIISALDRYREELGILRNLISNRNAQKIYDRLNTAAGKRRDWAPNKQ